MACEPSGDYYVNRAAEYAQKGEYEKAEADLTTALSQPLNTYSKQNVLTMLGNVYNEMELYDSAIIFHKQAIALDSSYAEALVNLGVVYRLVGEYDSAEIFYRKAAAVDPENPELHASLGALYIHKGDTTLALKHIKRSIAIEPKLAVGHANHAYVLAMIGDFENSEAELNTAIELGYKNGELMREKIEALR